MFEEEEEEPGLETTEVDTALPLDSSEGAIRLLQSQLRDLHYLQGPLDGKLGPETVEALKHFQRDVRLIDSGVATPETLERLADAVLRRDPSIASGAVAQEASPPQESANPPEPTVSKASEQPASRDLDPSAAAEDTLLLQRWGSCLRCPGHRE